MSFFEHWQFFLMLVLLLIPAMVLGICEKPLRHYTLFVSAVFVLSILGQTPDQLIYFLIFLLMEWVLLKSFLYLYRRHGRKECIYNVVLVLSLLPLILSKLQPWMRINLFCFVGISYITFKIVQMLIEVYDGVITELWLYDYLSFLIFFPTFSSGPIDRSRRFLENLDNRCTKEEYLKLAMNGITKLLIGYIYKTILAGRLYLLLSACLDMLDKGAGIFYEAGYAYIYGFYLFFDFAGYSMMAVGASYILGIRTPDNFKRPFLSTDLKDFWDRWHISLSHWFRDFVFTRFVIRCKKKKWFHTKLSRASAGFIVNMSIMGIWHGINLSYIIYGLYHGILLACTECWQKKSAFYKTYHGRCWFKTLSWLITMQLYMFGFYIFSGRLLCVLGQNI